MYTGLEVTVGQWSFTPLTESRNVPQETARMGDPVLGEHWRGASALRLGR